MADTTAALVAWNSVNGAELTVVADPQPVSSALPNSLEVKIPADSVGQVGFSNSGFWGRYTAYSSSARSHLSL